MAEPEKVVDDDKDCIDAISNFDALAPPGREREAGDLPHEIKKTGSVNLTMGKRRRLPM